jgi:hypothetical protein
MPTPYLSPNSRSSHSGQNATSLVVDVEPQGPAGLVARIVTAALGADESVAAQSFSQAMPSLSRSSPRL